MSPALSVRQPWAELIMLGRKTIELRTWSCDYRGRLWVHASRRADPKLDALFGLTSPFRGGYVGSVKVSAIVPLSEERWEKWRNRHLDPGPFPPGTLAWILDEPRWLRTPLPAPGKLGLFFPSPEYSTRLVQADPGKGEPEM
jgi:activating signal cointegrator 1